LQLNVFVDFAKGQSTRQVIVTPFADGIAEGDETVVLTVKPNSAYKVGSPDSATVTIADGDLPVVSIDINQTPRQSDEIVALTPGTPGTIVARVTNHGPSGQVDLSVSPTSAASLSPSTSIYLPTGVGTDVLITANTVSRRANDVFIVARSKGTQVGLED